MPLTEKEIARIREEAEKTYPTLSEDQYRKNLLAEKGYEVEEDTFNEWYSDHYVSSTAAREAHVAAVIKERDVYEKKEHALRNELQGLLSNQAASFVKDLTAERERAKENNSFIIQLLQELVWVDEQVGEGVAAIQCKAKMFLKNNDI